MMADWKERKPSIGFSCADVNSTYDELTRRGVHFKGIPVR
jgi:hypothetical protein